MSMPRMMPSPRALREARYDRAVEPDHGRLIDVDDSVLCVVDVQPGFVDGIGDHAARHAVVDRIAWLVAAARALDVPIVVTEEESDRNGETVAPVLAQLGLDQARHVKPVFGLAAVPEILAAVEASGRGTAVLVGLETDVCVSQSALGLLDRGHRVAVVHDATASPGQAHADGLARLRDAGAEIVATKGLYYEWIRTVERAHELSRMMRDVPLPEGLVL